MKIPALCVSESWRSVPKYLGYEISSFGNIRTYRPKNGRGAFLTTPRPMNSRLLKGKEYLRITLTTQAGHRKDEKIHQLVLLAFVGPRPSSRHDACHRDGNAQNNKLSNLYWGTRQDNADDRTRHGTQVRGETVGLSELTENQVKEIKAAIPYWKKGMGRKFALQFGVSDSAVSSVKLGKTWRHI